SSNSAGTSASANIAAIRSARTARPATSCPEAVARVQSVAITVLRSTARESTERVQTCVTPRRDVMSDFTAIQPDTIQIGDRTIRFLRYQPISNSQLLAALVVIEPSTTDMTPDVVVGFGRVDYEAKAD